MPNVMTALPNIGGALCSTPQSLADAQYWNAMPGKRDGCRPPYTPFSSSLPPEMEPVEIFVTRCQDAKPVEICRAAPNSPTDLSR